MKKRLLAAFLFLAYGALLIKVMVFKDLPAIHIGQLIFNFGGTDGGPANFVPFTTIVPYLFGNQGLVIAGINLLGNVALLVPIGALAPFVFKNMDWKKSLSLAVATGLAIELMQAVLHVGIFDIDDVILNAFGVMAGYGVFLVFARWIQSRSYKCIVITIATVIVATSAAFYALYPKGQVITPAEAASSQKGDPCGGTPGTGKITSIGSGTIVIHRNNNSAQTIKLTNRTVYKNPKGIASKADLRTGQRVTVVIDDSETASDVLVCKVTGSQIIHQ
jgi:glycopeptide antibiotics resistance protein